MVAPDARLLTGASPAMYVPIRDAATMIVVRDVAAAPSVLVGQRGAAAAFMPSKVVFPGGAVDSGDAHVALAGHLPDRCAATLGDGAGALAAAAIRELWEETGQVLGQLDGWPDPPAGWATFAATGHRPDATALRFVFRAITPPGRPRRFDARFFVADAAALAGDPDDFTAASDELSGLRWLPLHMARDADLPFITRVVLAEVAARLPDLAPPDEVPFFRGGDEGTEVLRLRAGN
jgi:8-oxo-dGTP pyrophosphatase MutT (NUDIX family)